MDAAKMSRHLTWMESAAAFPGNISLSSPAIAQAANIFQPFQAHMPHVTCTSPHLPVVQSALHKLRLVTQRVHILHVCDAQG